MNNYLVTFLCIAFGVLILIPAAFAFRELYRMSRRNECPFCGEYDGAIKRDDQKWICAFCGNLVDGPSSKNPPRAS